MEPSAADMPETRVVCAPFFAAADGMLESDELEYFDISLFVPTTEQIILQPNTTRVQIVDMDGMFCFFIYTNTV